MQLSKEACCAIALLMGTGVTLQAGVNSQLRLVTGSPILTALLSFSVGTLVLLVIFLLTSTQSLPPLSTLGGISWWKWMGGVLGACYITTVILIAPRIGAANTIGFLVAGQLIFAVVLDHFGLIGFSPRSVSLYRVLGVLLMLAGVYLVQKY
ncbi:MAG: DMT family transporter [Ferruginibacter sp.]|nr:DMT family transporter [Cytophagales bacterium]